ncbi:hypothetical protein BDN71DRAFT_1436945 [Pleurotus eryngii]|uniref:CxC2-like cysteine cluster KDZ transposase-associated domain-containing protein n=1 Tax=Pleurotus eryngii TaxID=5323 RepID=A0A9P6D916_PLEER|nr:hypothetical protein BDN71DRAFT_1436945 [Pleurotus eryngii]
MCSDVPDFYEISLQNNIMFCWLLAQQHHVTKVQDTRKFPVPQSRFLLDSFPELAKKKWKDFFKVTFLLLFDRFPLHPEYMAKLVTLLSIQTASKMIKKCKVWHELHGKIPTHHKYQYNIAFAEHDPVNSADTDEVQFFLLQHLSMTNVTQYPSEGEKQSLSPAVMALLKGLGMITQESEPVAPMQTSDVPNSNIFDPTQGSDGDYVTALLPRRCTAGDAPLLAWLPDRDKYIEELLRLKALNTDTSCIVEEHAGNLFHQVENSNSFFFEHCTLQSLSLWLQLGHAIGNEYVNPVRAFGNSFVVITSHGIKDRYTAFLQMVCEWQHIWLMECFGHRHNSTGVTGTSKGECTILCPMCPHPGKNLLLDWKQYGPSKSWIHSLFLAIDTNFHLKRLSALNDACNPSLNNGSSYFIQEGEYKAFLEQEDKTLQEVKELLQVVWAQSSVAVMI